MPPRFVVIGVFSRVEQLAARQAHNLKAGGSSPPPATEYTCEQIARAFHAKERTVRHHIAQFVRMGAPGVRRGKRPGDRRWCLLVSGELLGQWMRGELPAPWASAARSVG